MAFLFQSYRFHYAVGPQLSKRTQPTGRRKRETREESQLQHGRCYQMGLVFIEYEYLALVPLFFEGKISRMSSTTSWVRATYSCHHFRSPFRTTATLHSTYYFTHLSSYMYSQAISTCSHSPTCGTQSIWVVVHARLGAYAGVLYISDLMNYMQTPRRRINKSMNYYMKPNYFRGNRSTFIKFWT